MKSSSEDVGEVVLHFARGTGGSVDIEIIPADAGIDAAEVGSKNALLICAESGAWLKPLIDGTLPGQHAGVLQAQPPLHSHLQVTDLNSPGAHQGDPGT